MPDIIDESRSTGVSLAEEPIQFAFPWPILLLIIGGGIGAALLLKK